MFCVKCGKEIISGNKFCTFCGHPANQKNTEQKNYNSSSADYVISTTDKPKSKLSKFASTGIVIAIIMILLGMYFYEPQTKTSQNITSESSSSYTNNNSALSKFEVFEGNDDMPLTISSKAKDFLKENGDLFPVDKYSNIDSSLIDRSIDYKKISKNQDNFGDKLMEIDYAYVISIYETKISDNEYITEIQVVDESYNNYIIYYYGALDNIYDDSDIKIVGLPLGNTSFSNVGGGTTLAIVLAGSYISLIK